MASYVDFINSMLNLRKQKLKEEELQAKQEAADMAAITKSISSLGTSLGSAAKSYTQNATANELLNQASPPRAEAVMPGTTEPDVALNKSAAAAPLEGQIPYEQIPVTMEPATGGVAELKMRMAMDEEARKRMNATIDANQEERRMGISQGHLDLAQQRAAGTTPDQIADAKLKADATIEAAKRQQSADQVKAYENTYKASTKEYQESQKNAKAFDEATKLSLDAVNNAKTQKQYVDALGFLESHYQAAQKQGLKVEKPQVATWEELEAVKAKQDAIAQAAAGGPTDWNPLNNATYVNQVPGLQKELEAMPGYNKYGPRNVPIVGEGKEAQVAPNYLATPAMEKPIYAPPTGQVAAPVSGAAATGGGAQTISAEEAMQMGIPNPVPGKTYKNKQGKYVTIQ